MGIRRALSRLLGGGGADRRGRDGGSGRGPRGARGARGGEHPVLAGEQPRIDFADYEQVIQTVRSGVGASDDVVVHEMRLGLDRRRRAALVFVDGMVDRRVIGQEVATPLLKPGPQQGVKRGKSLLQVLSEQVLSATQTDSTDNYADLVGRILTGDTAVIVEGLKRALVIDTKKFFFRGPDRPLSELNIKGSFEGFTEVLKVNITQMRRRVRTDRLRVKTLTLGETAHNQVALLWIDGVANPALVEEALRRVQGVEHEATLLIAVIQCLIADNPATMFPLFRDTERPDFAAFELLAGKIVLMVDNTPFVTSLPSTLFDFLRSSEDYAAVFWAGSLLRPIRYIAFLVGIFLPGLYIAALSVHPVFIPHALALSIIASREGIPFPPVIEAALMLLVVEILREATTRLPSAMGPTLTTVGGIVLGSAAVNARIVSDLTLIVVAVAGIAQLIVPGFELSYASRILVWGFMLAGATFGLYGIVMGSLVLVAHVANLESMGVPYLGPVMTGEKTLFKDTIVRATYSSLRWRPAYLMPLERRKQGRVAPRTAGGRQAAEERFPVGIEPMKERMEHYPQREEGDRSPDGEPPAGTGQ